MSDTGESRWTALKRDLQERPLFYPLFNLYHSFMGIRRYDRMPYYIAPAAGKVVDYENLFIDYLDWLCDAHEEARNTEDRNRSFY